MLCVVCKNVEAVVHYAEVVDGEIKKLDLCEKCALDKGFGLELSFSVGEMASSGSGSSDKEKPGSCPDCKLSYAQFKKSGRVGCHQCYEVFETHLTSMVEQMHRGVQHKGKIPSSYKKIFEKKQEEEKLKLSLDEAIKSEDFEKAAQIRDTMRQLRENT